MNNNVNEMPLEIYVDYISEQLEQEWTLEILSLSLVHYACNGDNNTQIGNGWIYGYGIIYGLENHLEIAFGCGNSSGYGHATGHGHPLVTNEY